MEENQVRTSVSSQSTSSLTSDSFNPNSMKDQDSQGVPKCAIESDNQIIDRHEQPEISKTDAEQQEENDVDHDSNTSVKPRTVQLRFLVSRREAGALIGKGGLNIKRMRQIYSRSILNIPDTGNGPERIVSIATDKQTMEPILADFVKCLLAKSSQRDDQIELKLLIHSWHAGSLIGIGGQAIKKLRNDSKAAIKIYEMCCPLSNERVCAIKARQEILVKTICVIQRLVSENPHKGTVKPYDALHFDLGLVDKYGGFLPDETLYPIPNNQSNSFLQNYHLNHHHNAHLVASQQATSNSLPLNYFLKSLYQQTSREMVAALAGETTAANHLPRPSHVRSARPMKRFSIWEAGCEERSLDDESSMSNNKSSEKLNCDKITAAKNATLCHNGTAALAQNQTNRFHPYRHPDQQQHQLHQFHLADNIITNHQLQSLASSFCPTTLANHNSNLFHPISSASLYRDFSRQNRFTSNRMSPFNNNTNQHQATVVNLPASVALHYSNCHNLTNNLTTIAGGTSTSSNSNLTGAAPTSSSGNHHVQEPACFCMFLPYNTNRATEVGCLNSTLAPSSISPEYITSSAIQTGASSQPTSTTSQKNISIYPQTYLK